ncbi:MAG: hypothetical protein WKF55_07560 [Gemmatimonadaceae bacterium]
MGAAVVEAQPGTDPQHSATPGHPAGRDTAWTIGAGVYAGIRVPIELERARAGKRAAGSFLRTAGPAFRGRLVGWNPSRFPIPVALKHAQGEAITAGDSAAFWSTLGQMEADIGMRLFVPATLGPNDDPVDAIIVALKATAGDEGVTLITWTSGGDVYDARVFLRSQKTLHDPRIVAHEMVHALGFGHTTAWASIMNPSTSRIMRLTPLDVAHVQLGITSRVSAQRQDIWRKLSLAQERDPKSTSRSGEGCRYTDNSPAESFDYGVAAGFKSPAACNFCLCSVP